MNPVCLVSFTFHFFVMQLVNTANAAPPSFTTSTSDVFMQQAGPAGIQTMFDANGQVVYQSGGTGPGVSSQQPSRPSVSGFPLVINYPSSDSEGQRMPAKKKPAPFTPQVQIINTPGSNCYMANFGPFFMQFCNPPQQKTSSVNM